jgi:hypothetical protein
MSSWIVAESFGPEHIAKFLDGADLWVIAAARVHGAAVVTQERAVGPGAKKIKIPDVCAKFGIRSLTTFELLQEVGARFSG